MIANFDVDIDTPPEFEPHSLFPNWPRASIIKNEELLPHPCGYYPQNIAVDKLTNLSAIDYETAESLGYFKLDLLHLSVYSHFKDRSEIEQLIEIEPDWTILQSPQHVVKLFQLSKHIELLQKLKPSSIEDVADALALIRPGKIELLPLYLNDKSSIRSILYKQDRSGYSFKRSHAISYSLVIVLQLHLIDLGLL